MCGQSNIEKAKQPQALEAAKTAPLTEKFLSVEEERVASTICSLSQSRSHSCSHMAVMPAVTSGAAVAAAAAAVVKIYSNEESPVRMNAFCLN